MELLGEFHLNFVKKLSKNVRILKNNTYIIEISEIATYVQWPFCRPVLKNSLFVLVLRILPLHLLARLQLVLFHTSLI